MASLSRDLRRELERTVIEARRVGENGSRKALESLAVHHYEPWSSMTTEQRDLRNRLRLHGRQLGDRRDERRGTQTVDHLVSECAYEHWHRMLFARFLAESNLLIEPESQVAISLDDCRELAIERGTDWLSLASDFSVRMLPKIFRKDDPILEVALPPESRHELEELLKALAAEIFTAEDSLGWVYQFWQTERKNEVNSSGEKIGADELPAVTQLFTEDYMVLFLLHNTLGAWWTAKRQAEGKDANLPGYDWYYLRLKEDGTPAAGTYSRWPKLARDIKLLDPSMGSGHFLTFALPILVGFRMEEEGLSREQAIHAVLRNNLFGLEIDNRCTQIAAFNLALTAWRMLGGFSSLPSVNVACSGLGINAKEEDWVKLAGKSDRLRETMRRLYGLFRQAPLLASLIDPTTVGGTLFSAVFNEVRPLLEQALAAEQGDEGAGELAVAAQGIVQAAALLCDHFTLVTTNVPYLSRSKQNDEMREYCDGHFARSKNDLATSFLERCLQFCSEGGTASIVLPTNWLVLGRYKKLREHILRETEIKVLARLGPGAFETISGEVVNVALFVVSNQVPRDNAFIGIDAGEQPGPERKAAELRTGRASELAQRAQLRNPDARLLLEQQGTIGLLKAYADSRYGLRTGDLEKLARFIWELPFIGEEWTFLQGTVDATSEYGGRERVLLWEQGQGKLHELADEGIASIQGADAWGRRGVAVSLMSDLPVTLYTGEVFDNGTGVIWSFDPENLAAVYAFCASSEFNILVRKIDHSIKVTNQTLLKVPFDLARWNTEAVVQYPAGLPTPHSSDPTQWLFVGDPAESSQPLHVGLARLLGYKWPRQTGSKFIDCPVLRPDSADKHADADGIVCLGAMKGERPAADRLRDLLAAAYGGAWSASKQAELLSQVGYAGKTLEEWLRDGFFEQHCELFHQRPFVWHIWDGLRDGFHALLNYHKFAASEGEGRRALDKLIYTYLGDWIDRQRAEQKKGVEGADARVAAATHLRSELEKIAAGKPPYDIFVRWKPLHEQPSGWEPDINDGVRINIRPFMTAKVLNGRGKGTCILRTTPKVKWDKDRGKEPLRPKEDFPWFWSWDESTQDFQGGREFDGNRWNDLHYTCSEKERARARHVEKHKGAAK